MWARAGDFFFRAAFPAVAPGVELCQQLAPDFLQVEFGVVMKGSKVRTAATVDVLQPPDQTRLSTVTPADAPRLLPTRPPVPGGLREFRHWMTMKHRLGRKAGPVSDIVAAGQRVPNPQQTAVCHFLRLALGVAGDDEPVYLEPREENHVVLHCSGAGPWSWVGGFGLAG